MTSIDDLPTFPPVPPDRTGVSLPVVRVTLLEDRARVVRRGPAPPGRLVIPWVAPVMRDVSLRASSSAGRVADVRVRRALRAREADRPDDVRALDAEIDALTKAFEDATMSRLRAETRSGLVMEMLDKAVREIPAAAAWGLADHGEWQRTFETLFARSRELGDRLVTAWDAQTRTAEELSRLAVRRRAMARADWGLVAWIEVDVIADAPVELEVEYTVPNALWRPIHSARLDGADLEVRSAAAVWQNTGEDWSDVELQFSTARSSLGTEPPPLHDDLLKTKKKADEVVVEAREVRVRTAGVTSTSDAVELPGVDDGGEVRNLAGQGRFTLPSDGRPHLVPVMRFTSAAEVERVCLPELAERVFLRCVATNRADVPMLAGPVELVRDSGTVGWTQTLFVAPGERFELSFGPEPDLRVTRDQRVTTRTDEVDKYREQRTQVDLYLSNLGHEARQLRITERVPVSEIEHVKVLVDADRVTDDPDVDDDGFVRWEVGLDAGSVKRVTLAWRLRVAPGVQGLF